MKRLLPTLALCTMLLALPLLSLAPRAHAAASFPSNWIGVGHGTSMDNCVKTGGVNVNCYGVNMWKIWAMGIACDGVPVKGKDGCSNDALVYNDLLQKSAINTLTNSIAMMYIYQPASSMLAVRDFGKTLGFLPSTAQAQGVGFSGLSALLPLWKAFRNIAYLLLAVIMIVVGFMVMLRKKIDPKTVLTVQNALPRIVVTLILITFSYAIVGILIDFMYVVTLLVISLLGNAVGLDGAKLQNAYINEGYGKIFWSLFVSGNQSIPEILSFIFPLNAKVFISGLTTVGTGSTIALILAGASLVNPATWLPFAFTGGVAVLLYLIFVIIIFFAFLRIAFMLLSSYINIIVSLLIGPLQILFDALPGSNSFTSWILNLLSNILVFPATVGLLLLGSILATLNTGQVWAPPLISAAGEGSNGISGILALGLLLSIPAIVNNIKEMLKAKALPVTSGLATAISSPVATGVQIISTAAYVKQLGGGMLWGRIAKKPGGGTDEHNA